MSIQNLVNQRKILLKRDHIHRIAGTVWPVRWTLCPDSHSLRCFLFGTCLVPFSWAWLCLAVIMVVSQGNWRTILLLLDIIVGPKFERHILYINQDKFWKKVSSPEYWLFVEIFCGISSVWMLPKITIETPPLIFVCFWSNMNFELTLLCAFSMYCALCSC